MQLVDQANKNGGVSTSWQKGDIVALTNVPFGLCYFMIMNRILLGMPNSKQL